MIKRISFGLVILVGLIIAYNLINQIREAVKAGDRLSAAADIVHKLEAKNRALKEQLLKIRSVEFIEGEARNKLGMSKKRETVVVISEEKLKFVLGVSQSAQIRLPNWLGWWRVFFR